VAVDCAGWLMKAIPLEGETPFDMASLIMLVRNVVVRRVE
jgi:hypothetical protein